MSHITGLTRTISQVLCRLRHEDGVPFRAMCRNEEQI
jgi:hypothetical protein